MKRKPTDLDLRIGSWLSSALDAPKSCDAFKTDIMDWYDEQDYSDIDPDFNPFNSNSNDIRNLSFSFSKSSYLFSP